MGGQYDYIFRYYGVRPVIGGRVEHTVTHEFGTILKEGGSNLHYVRVQFDGYADTSYCHPTELDYLAPDEIEPVAIPSAEAIEAVMRPFVGRPLEDGLIAQMTDALLVAFPVACRQYGTDALLEHSRAVRAVAIWAGGDRG